MPDPGTPGIYARLRNVLSPQQALRRGALVLLPTIALAMSGCASTRVCPNAAVRPMLRLSLPPAPEPRNVEICLNGVCTQNIADTNARTIQHSFTPAFAGEKLDIKVTVLPPDAAPVSSTTKGRWLGQNVVAGDVCTQALHLNLVLDAAGTLTAPSTF